MRAPAVHLGPSHGAWTSSSLGWSATGAFCCREHSGKASIVITTPQLEAMRAGGGGEDPNKSHTDSDNDDDGYGRRTILVADENVLKYPGESGFSNALGRTFQSTESTALEKTLELKHKLRQATGYDFWQVGLDILCCQ